MKRILRRNRSRPIRVEPRYYWPFFFLSFWRVAMQGCDEKEDKIDNQGKEEVLVLLWR